VDDSPNHLILQSRFSKVTVDQAMLNPEVCLILNEGEEEQPVSPKVAQIVLEQENIKLRKQLETLKDQSRTPVPRIGKVSSILDMLDDDKNFNLTKAQLP